MHTQYSLVALPRIEKPSKQSQALARLNPNEARGMQTNLASGFQLKVESSTSAVMYLHKKLELLEGFQKYKLIIPLESWHHIA